MNRSSSSQKRRLLAASLATTLVCVGAVVATAAPASAYRICDKVAPTYTITYAGPVWKATSLSGSYIRGPGTSTIAQGRTWTVSASMTATVAAEANVIFAKASTSLGITVGGSYSGTQTISYALNVDRGAVRRVQQYKMSKKFTVRRYDTIACNAPRLTYTSSVIAPVKSNDDRYFLYALTA